MITMINSLWLASTTQLHRMLILDKHTEPRVIRNQLLLVQIHSNTTPMFLGHTPPVYHVGFFSMFSLFFTRLFGLRKITTVTSGKESKGFCFLCTGLGGVLGFRLADSRITRITQHVKCSFPNPQREKISSIPSPCLPQLQTFYAMVISLPMAWR